ncbi:MAG: biotin/lipoyl-binding protein [Candidatus Thalassarchaeaceae archaeon]|jgi:3-methylcrotonyl-CoA carboxylase alpha subunit|nr:biotin/lipoyl-binding protein [Euryarchaeota archaeon]MDG1548171.1 biotin/lipoyl-binding protein [Candidatus Thalassarchaeaceae archaeon]DAC62471.1 MAG TPA: biotin/lipoyl-binding protein [Candidatus Poseidoniales archaeon]MBT3847209.1 biotin/lipoyl-binding protein [Euryarchaeota archaeon]MBT4156062.1 biotin/lipoyl-binding protein [Euryarchaeota archaeon]
MEWSIDNSGSRYIASFSETDGKLKLSKIVSDNNEQLIPDISISRDEKPGRILVELEGVTSFAHVIRSDDKWWIHFQGHIYVTNMHEPGSKDSSLSEGSLSAPMPGTILDVLVKSGQRVRQGQTLLIMEAMKMEHRIQAPKAGEVTVVHFQKGDRVDMGQNLVEIGE